MNNKGQALILFVMILPVGLLLIYFVYTRIVLYSEKQQQENLANTICRYYKKGKKIDELENIVVENDKDQAFKLIEEDNKIKISLEKEINDLLNKKRKIKTELVCE